MGRCSEIVYALVPFNSAFGSQLSIQVEYVYKNKNVHQSIKWKIEKR